MFWFGNKKKVEELDKKTQKAFSGVSKDIGSLGKWIKHLDRRDKQLFDLISLLRGDLSSIQEEIESLREGVELAVDEEKKQTAV